MNAGCAVTFDLEVGKAAVRSLGVKAIYAIVEGIEIIEEQHVIEFIDMNSVNRAVREHDLFNMAPFLRIHGCSLLVCGIPLGRPKRSCSDRETISGSTFSRVSVKGQTLD